MSTVSGGFWCDAPPGIKQRIFASFGDEKDRVFDFEVQEEQNPNKKFKRNYEVKILSRGGFSGGWRGLAILEVH